MEQQPEKWNRKSTSQYFFKFLLENFELSIPKDLKCIVFLFNFKE